MLVLVLCGSAIAPGQSAALVPPPPEPSENPITMDKVRLGQALFWDEQLSSTGTVACGTCHGMSSY